MTNPPMSPIGSMIFKTPFTMLRISIAASLCLCATGTDLVTLENGDLFEGNVVGLSDNTISLTSPHSSSPLKIVGENLRHIQFDNGDLTKNPTHSQLIHLKNGDSLPGQVTALDDSTLTFDTWFAGALRISRKHVDSVYFGVTPQKVTFQGPTGTDGWDIDDDEWSFFNSTLGSNKRGSIGRNLTLPEDFIFSTTVNWNNSPQLQIFLCTEDTTIDPDRGTNNYLINFNTSGLEVRRQLSKEEKGSRYHSLISTKLNLNNFKSGKKEITVELRVNRREGEVHLYLDGEYIKHGVDPKPPPTGQCVIFNSNSSNRRDLSLKNIILKEWDTVTQNLRREARVDEKSDTIATNDGDRYCGVVSNLNLIEEQKNFTVNVPLLENPLSIPLDQCVVLYFSDNDDALVNRPPFKLSMHSGGSLSLSEVSLGSNSLEASHPALGNLKLDRRILSEITRHKTITPEPEEDTSEKESGSSNPE